MNKLERYAKRFGPDRIQGMVTQMKANGRPWGIDFSYGGNVGNTLNSHRLIEYSKQESQGAGVHTDKLINRLFNAYFEREQDIADIEVLVDAAVQAGLPASAEEVRTFLKGDALRSEVESAVSDAQEAGISGVPHFIINNTYSVSGAQEPETFANIFARVGVA